MGKQPPAALPVITAGDSVRHTWCQYCQEPWRVRVPLYADGLPAGALEVCTGCGATYDQVGVYITPPDPDQPPPPPEPPRRPLLPRIAARIHTWACARKGLQSPGCAHIDCPWPGLWRHAVPFEEDDGTTTFLFCSGRHKRTWAVVNGVVLSLTTVRLGT